MKYLFVESISETDVPFLRKIVLIFGILPEGDSVAAQNSPVSTPIAVV